MDTFLAFLFVGSLLVILVGAILFFIDYAQKRNKRKSLIIIGIGFIIAIISLLGFGAIEHHDQKVAEEKQAEIAQVKKQKDKKFKSAASEYLAEYYVLFGQAEKLGNSVNKDWGKAIDDDSEGYDVDKTVEGIEDRNSDKISEISDGQSELDGYLSKLKKNDTGKYNLKDYEKANDKITDLTNKVTSPSGSYSSFGDDFSDADDAVSKQFDIISKSL